MTEGIQAGDWLEGPFWQGAVQVVSIQPRKGHDEVTVHAPEWGQTRSCILTSADWAQVHRITQADRRRSSFSGDPTRFRLGIEAHRLRLAHAIDPYAALNASRVDPLPHQIEAVYDHLLARPVVRALLAHDAGAGKTIMAGLVIKELQRRQRIRRILIVAPAGLTEQWRRELITRFGEDFTIISRGYMEEKRLDSLEVWRETDLAITSMAFARQKAMRQALESVEWDLVVVDEAHHMAAYARPGGSVDRRQAYRLGEILSRHSTHFLLVTATPHKDDPENYRLLVNLISPRWGEAAAYAQGANPLVLRRTKEEMRRADGRPLYPERIVDRKYYSLFQEEGALLEQVQRFIKGRFARAQTSNRQSATFALLTLERRLASSPQALLESLRRIKTRTEARLQAATAAIAPVQEGEDWDEWEDLSEQERWQQEARAEEDLAALVERRQLGAELQSLHRLIAAAEAIAPHGRQEKLARLHEACDLWVGQHGEQLIVFTEFKDTLDYLVDHLARWGYPSLQIHGGMDTQERRQVERDFWAKKAPVLVATEAAGEGINLQCCRVMVNFDLPWNPCRLEQRMGRIHRYGQMASQVHIFNLIAQNTMEGQVQEVLLKKLDQMRSDLGDKVFDVVGTVLWGEELRDVLARLAMGEDAVQEATQLIERAGEAARQAVAVERGATVTAEPLDILDFQRRQATFNAYRLSPEAADRFFRQAVPFIGGTLREFTVTAKDEKFYPAGEVTLPADLWPRGRTRVSFWPAACSDDDTEDGAVLFIAPGHRLFEIVLAQVLAHCIPDLNEGAVFLDPAPEDESPHLVWFVRSGVRDGLDRRVADLLAVVRHRADEERVVPLPSEILDRFDLVQGPQVEEAIHQVRPMLAAQREVGDQCVEAILLPALAEQRDRQQQALDRDRRFLEQGLTAVAEHLSEAALDAIIVGNEEEANQLTDQAAAAQQRLAELRVELERGGHLLLTTPETLGVALVVPAPATILVEEGGPVAGVPMRRDEKVEAEAMRIALEYEAGQGRQPRDVHEGHSWDIESDNAQGVIERYIEVKGRGPEDAAEVTLTEPEWAAAQRLGDQYWLYIVRLADGMMWMIRNPTAKLQPKELVRWVVRIADAASYAEETHLGRAGERKP